MAHINVSSYQRQMFCNFSLGGLATPHPGPTPTGKLPSSLRYAPPHHRYAPPRTYACPTRPDPVPRPAPRFPARPPVPGPHKNIYILYSPVYDNSLALALGVGRQWAGCLACRRPLAMGRGRLTRRLRLPRMPASRGPGVRQADTQASMPCHRARQATSHASVQRRFQRDSMGNVEKV